MRRRPAIPTGRSSCRLRFAAGWASAATLDGYRFEAAKGVDLCVRGRRPPRRLGVRPGLAAAGRQGSDPDRGRRHARAWARTPGSNGRRRPTASIVVQVADLHDRGGAAFGYVLLAEAARPDFTLICDPDMINVGPGGRVPVFVRLTRRQGFAGAVSLSWESCRRASRRARSRSLRR